MQRRLSKNGDCNARYRSGIMNTPLHIRIREQSLLAAIAARKLRVERCALVIGTTIHLHGANGLELIGDAAWLRHEICHVRQWQRDGFLPYLFRYLWFSLRNGYRQNPYELEAREAGADPDMMNGVCIAGENNWLE